MDDVEKNVRIALMLREYAKLEWDSEKTEDADKKFHFTSFLAGKLTEEDLKFLDAILHQIEFVRIDKALRDWEKIVKTEILK